MDIAVSRFPSIWDVIQWLILAFAAVKTNAGKAQWVSRQRGLGTEQKWVGWGTGAGTAAVGDTDLFTPASEARVSGTTSSVTTTVANDTFQCVALITADAAKTITNVGTFDASTGGTLCDHADFAGVALALGDGINFTLKTPVS